MNIKNTAFFDVIVCGAGPAGCAAAISLARQGARVLLLDKSRFPREKPCGGLLTQKTCQIITDQLKINNLDTVIQHRSNGLKIFHRQRCINSTQASEWTYYVCRKDFDQLLFEAAEDAGCSILLNASIENRNHENKLKIKGKWFQYGFLIGADGVHSRVRRLIDVPRPRKNMAFGLQVDIPVHTWQQGLYRHSPEIFFGYIKYGWAWIFPKGDHLSIGLAGLADPPRQIQQAFHAFLRDISCVDPARKNQIRGAAIPYGWYVKNPGRENILLAGDAAGFVDPVTGEGIYFALLSGYHAAQSILTDGNTQKHYQEICRKKIIAPLRQARSARFFLFNEPFHSYALKKLQQNPDHIKTFSKVLSGAIDYKGYFHQAIKNRLLRI